MADRQRPPAQTSFSVILMITFNTIPKTGKRVDFSTLQTVDKAALVRVYQSHFSFMK